MKNDFVPSKSFRAARKNCDKETSLEQRLKKENEKLKRQISKLRKVIDKLDIDRYNDLKELIASQEYENAIDQGMENNKAKEKAWKCFDCQEGVLRIKRFENRTGMRYYRKCDMCRNRTKAKQWTKDVDGVE